MEPTTTQLDALPNVIERAQLERTIELARDILNDSVKDAFDVQRSYATVDKYGAKENLALIKELRTVGAQGDNPLNQLESLVKRILPQIDVIDRLVRKEIPTRVTRDYITYRQFAVIKLVSDLDTFAQYTMSLIQYVGLTETAFSNKLAIKSLTNQGFLDKIETGYYGYIESIKALSEKDIEARVKGALEAAVSGTDVGLLVQTHGADKVNPFKFGFIGTSWNPIKRILMGRAEARAKQYQLTREQLRLYEAQLRMIETVKNKSATVDPRLAQDAEELTMLVEETAYELARLEKAYD